MERAIRFGEAVIPQKQNKLEIRVAALPRSGHHGVIGWLFGHFSGEIIHYNDVAVAEHDDSQPNYAVLNETAGPDRDLYIFNVEDRDLQWAMTAISTNRWRTNGGPSRVVRHMLVLRDPFNNFASFFKLFGPDLFFSRGTVAKWKQYAREFLGETQLLPEATVKVSFTDWFLSKDYRRLISDNLGIKFSDARFRVPYGPDSAFEQGTDASARKALDRWRCFLDDPVFVDVFRRDPELAQLAEAIYGDFAVNIMQVLKGCA